MPNNSAKRTISQSGGRLCFRVGHVHIALISELEEVVEHCAGCYGACPATWAAPRTLQIEVKRQPHSFLRRKRYAILGDGIPLFSHRRREDVVPYVEWGINRHVIASCRDYLQLHAATMVRHGQGVILAGHSGSGKSTLAAALLARGWTYLCDEFALVNPANLLVHPFPKALCIKAGSFGVVERLGLPLWHRRYYVSAYKGQVGYVIPPNNSPRGHAVPSPIRYAIFPQYVRGGTPRLSPMARAPAAFLLSGLVLNRNTFGTTSTSIISAVIRNAECFRLQSGPVEETCDLLESLFSNTSL